MKANKNQRRSRRFLGLVATALILGVGASGCGMSDKVNPFKKEEKRLPGERIAVLKARDQFQVDPAVAKKPLSIPAPTGNQNWSQPGGNTANSFGHVQFSGGLGSLWKADIGSGSSDDGRLSASPIAYGGKIFTLDAKGVASAFSATGGARLWRVNLAPENEDGDEGYGGGMAAANGRVFVTTGFGIVYALDASSGEVAWQRRIGVPLRASPTAIDDKVFFVSTDARLHCLSTTDGVELWSVRGLPEAASLLNNASPAVAGDQVVVTFPSGEVAAYPINGGRPAWVDSLSRSDSGALSTLAVPARPAISQGIVYAVGNSGRMIATAQKTGERLWTKKVQGNQMPWPAGEAVFVVDVNGVLIALNRRDGKIRWLTELPQSRQWSGPVMAGGRLYLISSEGVMVSVDASSGSIASQRSLGTSVLIAPIVAAGRMYVLTDKASLVALN